MMRELAENYRVEIDSVDKNSWYDVLRNFDDANIYQTWAYDETRCGRKNISHMVLKKDEEIVAAAQLRLARIPVIGAGAAYVRWGPLFRPKGATEDLEAFSQAIRALRNEYACRRGLVLRIYPFLFDDESERYLPLLSQGGFKPLEGGKRDRTLIIDLRPKLEDLRKGLNQKWRNSLNRAERNGLEVIEGDGDELFETFIEKLYRPMVARKQFVEPNDINEFRLIQQKLPPSFRMRIILCRLDGQLCAGSIFSAIGSLGVYLFGATNDVGMQSNGSYLQQWRFIEWMKEHNFISYDLNGINPETNPGTYKFKEGLCGKNGRDVYFMGQFQTFTSLLSSLSVKFGESLLSNYQRSKEALQDWKSKNQ
ncbi:MAG: FemAB family protein [Syntrophus sp. PtaB.Bin138]|nr:MAG: FemAB family protein [Syntrophus sp. PtaB.Bin138]